MLRLARQSDTEGEADRILATIGAAIHPADDGSGGAPVTVPAGALAVAVLDGEGRVRGHGVQRCDGCWGA